MGAGRGEAERGARDESDVGKMGAAGVGIVEDPELARPRLVLEHGGDRVRHGAEMHRDVLRLRDHPAVGVEERRGAVATLLDVRREGTSDEDRAHLLRDGAQHRADHLQLDVHAARSSTSVP